MQCARTVIIKWRRLSMHVYWYWVSWSMSPLHSTPWLMLSLHCAIGMPHAFLLMSPGVANVLMLMVPMYSYINMISLIKILLIVPNNVIVHKNTMWTKCPWKTDPMPAKVAIFSSKENDTPSLWTHSVRWLTPAGLDNTTTLTPCHTPCSTLSSSHQNSEFNAGWLNVMVPFSPGCALARFWCSRWGTMSFALAHAE